MRRYYIVSGILLILPISIFDFAVAAPVRLVQEKSQLPADVEYMPEDVMTTLEKRVKDLYDELAVIEDHFAKPEYTSVRVGQPLSPIPEEFTPVSSPDHEPSNPGSLTGSGYELMEGPWDEPPRPSSPASSTMSDADPGLVDADALPNSGLSTESEHMLTGMNAPLSSAVYPTWFHQDHGLMEAHAPQPNLGSSNPRLSTEFDTDHGLVVEEPPSGPASPTESDADHHEPQVAHRPPPGSASPTESDDEIFYEAPSSPVLTNSDRRSMGADSLLENLKVVSDALKGSAKELRRIFRAPRDVLNAT
jgi:hypothetical protein